MPPHSAFYDTTKRLTCRCASQSEPAVDSLNLVIEDRAFLALVGRSGYGKSVLLPCLPELIPQTSEGEIQRRVEICGLDTRFRPLSKLASVAGKVISSTPEG